MRAEKDCSNAVARRTRSQLDALYRNIHQEIKKKRGEGSVGKSNNVNDNGGDRDFEFFGSGKHGSFAKERRVNQNDVELNSSVFLSSDESEESSDEEYKLNVSKNVRKSVGLGRRKTGSPPKKVCIKRGADVIESLVESIWKEKDSVQAEQATFKRNAPTLSTVLPLKFRFEDDKKSSVQEKTDMEKEVDCLFRELELALGESEIGCTNFSTTTDDEDTSSVEIDKGSTVHCTSGQHDLFLDEQIGIRCKYCSALLLEMKHVLPSFYVEPPERRKTKDFGELQYSAMNKFQFQGSAYDNLESSIQSEGTVMDLIPDTEKELYPHQREGFKFMWKNIVGDIQIKNLVRMSANQGGGCIISHAPGTGKTRLTITFLQTFMKVYPACRPVIIAPRGMLMTWEQEIRKWKVDIKFHNLNEIKLSSQETEIAASVVGPTQVNENDKDSIRFLKLLSWMKGGCILGIGYQLFEKLAGEHKKKGTNEKFRKILLELPGLLVLDEGHTPRNNQSLMWNALRMVTTQRRIILSGTPFQNNLSELYNTLCLANPRFSHQKGEWDHLTSSVRQNKTDDEGFKKVRSVIEPFVHVHQGGVIRKTLPGMRECLVILKPTELQSKLLQSIDQVEKHFDQAHLASLISVHPSLVASPSLLAKNPDFSTYKNKLQKLKPDPNAGVKTRFLIELIKLSARLGEKILIFSQFIDPLRHIKKLLTRQFSWNEGREVIYMDGELGIKKRQHFIDCFNDKSSFAKVMLASQRACSEGINLVGASRVVLLDVVWNPSVERQAISRAYRIGQEKIVYVYHLVTLIEVKKYARQAEKERISELIFSEGNEGRAMGTSENDAGLEDKVLEAIVGHSSLSGMFEKIVHNPKESDLVDAFGLLDLKHDSHG